MSKMNVSTLSKMYKSKEWKARKNAQHTENANLRASLHKEKANAGNCGKRAEIQSRIDAISNKG